MRHLNPSDHLPDGLWAYIIIKTWHGGGYLVPFTWLDMEELGLSNLEFIIVERK